MTLRWYGVNRIGLNNAKRGAGRCDLVRPFVWLLIGGPCTVGMRGLFTIARLTGGDAVPFRHDALDSPRSPWRYRGRSMGLIGALAVALLMHLFAQATSVSHAGTHQGFPSVAVQPAPEHVGASEVREHLGPGHADPPHTPCGEARAPASSAVKLPTPALLTAVVMASSPSHRSLNPDESGTTRSPDVVRVLGVQRV
jgi:hypothetical protein